MNHPLRNLLIQLYVSPPESAPQLLASIQQEDVHELLERARLEKIFPTIYERLQNRFELADEHHEHYARGLQARAEVLRILAACAEHAPTESEYLVIKGPGIEAYYPPHQRRFFHDLDLSVPDIERFWQVGAALLANGLDQFATMTLYEEPRTRQAGGPLIQGSARFDPIEEQDAFKGVEVQIGTFPMSSRTSLPYSVFTRHRREIEIEGIRLPVPDREGNLIVYLAELIDRKRMPVRDLVDVLYILNAQEAEEIDLDHVAEQVRTYRLHDSLDLLRRGFAAAAPVLPTPDVFRRLVARVGLPEGYRKRSFSRSHVWPCLKNTSNRPVRDMLFHLLREGSNKLNDEDRLLSSLKRLDIRWGARPFYANGAYCYFMKLSDASGPWSWRKIDHYDIVQTPIGTFLACMHALYGDEELDLLLEKIDGRQAAML